MFNLIVSGRVEDDRRGFIYAERVFGFTADEIRTQFEPDGQIDFRSVKALPTLLLQEGKSEEIARIARLSRVTRNGRDYQLDYVVDPDLLTLTNAEIFALRAELDIDDWEFSTNHWAIKDVDLFEVLFKRSAGKRFDPTVFRLSDKPIKPKLVSFMMPFSGAFSPVYQGLKAALEADGYTCQRADDMWVNQHIMADIIELICTSAVVVCDLSGRNPNVFYEAGIAHTLGKQVILITQSHDDVPFDLRPIRYIRYLNNGEGQKTLATEVLSRVRTLT